MSCNIMSCNYSISENDINLNYNCLNLSYFYEFFNIRNNYRIILKSTKFFLIIVKITIFAQNVSFAKEIHILNRGIQKLHGQFL